MYFNNLRNFVGEAIVLILLLAVGIFFIPVLTLSNISNLIGYSAVLALLTGLFLITHHHAATGCILTFLLSQAMYDSDRFSGVYRLLLRARLLRHRVRLNCEADAALPAPVCTVLILAEMFPLVHKPGDFLVTRGDVRFIWVL